MFNVSQLGLAIGQVFKLTEADWEFKAPAGKSRAALVGLAIDQHIKALVLAAGADVPEDRFSPFDFKFDGVHFDIKSFSRGSVSISDREMMFADGLGDQDLVYAVFEQVDDEFFTFRGYVSFKTLSEHRKIRPSQYSGYYFTLNDSAVRKHLFE